KAEVALQLSYLVGRLETAQRSAVLDDRKQLEGPPFARDTIAVALENFDLGARGDFDRHDAAFGGIAEQQPVAVKLRRYFLPSTHAPIVSLSILDCGSSAGASVAKNSRFPIARRMQLNR